jgi:hypothetical protein
LNETLFDEIEREQEDKFYAKAKALRVELNQEDEKSKLKIE